MPQHELMKVFKAYYQGEESLETVLKELKASGASPMDCVKLLKRELEISLKEADQIVLNSQTWEDINDETIALRDTFSNTVENSEELD